MGIRYISEELVESLNVAVLLDHGFPYSYVFHAVLLCFPVACDAIDN